MTRCSRCSSFATAAMQRVLRATYAPIPGSWQPLCHWHVRFEMSGEAHHNHRWNPHLLIWGGHQFDP